MSVHASIHVDKDVEAMFTDDGESLIISGSQSYGLIVVDRDETPGFFDALVEFFELKLPESVEAG